MTDWVQRSPGVKLRILADGEKLMLVEAALDAQAVVPTHQHIHEQVTFIVEGQVEFTLGSQQRTLRAGEAVHIPSNIPHQVVALVDTRLLDAFSPPREDFRTVSPAPTTATTTASVETQSATSTQTRARQWYGLGQQQALKVAPSVDAQVIRDDYKEGLWLGKKGDVSGDPKYFREAIVFFERVIQYAGEDPAYVNAYNAMAACYRRIGDRVLYEAYKAEYEKRQAEIAG